MEELQQIIDNLIAEHGKEAIQTAIINSTSTDPLPPDPTHPKP